MILLLVSHKPEPDTDVCVMQLQRSATMAAYTTAPSGESNTTDYRLYMEKAGAPSVLDPSETARHACAVGGFAVASIEAASTLEVQEIN